MKTFWLLLAGLLGALAGCSAVPVAAQSGIDGLYGQVAVQAITAKRSREEFEDANSSGISGIMELGYRLQPGKNTQAIVQARATVFDYAEEGRDTRTTLAIGAQLRQRISRNVELRLRADYIEDGVALEGLEVDETRLLADVHVISGRQRLEVQGGYRWREYGGSAVTQTGEGGTFSTRLRHSFGSWHWVALRYGHDWIDSAQSSRDYRRDSFLLDYSHPLKRNLQARASLRYFEWTFTERMVATPGGSEARQESLLRPEVGLNYGASRGFYGQARLGYDFRDSNDFRQKGEGLRASLRLGYRF